jgi:hypothetical protein
MHDNIGGGRGEELERSGNARDIREPYFWILNTEKESGSFEVVRLLVLTVV